MARLVFTIRNDNDWLRLVAFNAVLKLIVEAHKADPYGFSGEDAAEMARRALEAFPERQGTEDS